MVISIYDQKNYTVEPSLLLTMYLFGQAILHLLWFTLNDYVESSRGIGLVLGKENATSSWIRWNTWDIICKPIVTVQHNQSSI